MLLRNKKTGEIVEWFNNTDGMFPNSLAELNAEWEDVPEEKWRDVLGFEELYQVSSFGNVRTIKKGEAEMSQQENRNGYMTVHLRDKGVERRAMVHRLVAEAFIPNPDGLRDVNHKNGDKSDNRVENLEWVSHSDNMTHSFRELGQNVRHIVQLDLDNNFIERWNSIVEASEATGICRTDIGECCRGNRKHTKGYKWKYEEDYEEPKEYWYISDFGYVFNHEINNKSVKSTIEEMKSIGNYFLSREEAELAVRKLKAFKRLKDKGFRFRGLCESVHELPAIEYDTDVDVSRDSQDVEKDLDLLFSEGGEE